MAELPRQPRGDAGEVDQEREEPRVLAQQREDLHAGRQAGDELVEQPERGVGVGLLLERLEDRGMQLGQQLARPRAAGGADVAVVPAADAGRDGGRVLEAHRGEVGERVGIVAGAGEDEAAAGPEVGLALEQRRVVPLDRGQRLQHRGLERLPVREPGERGEALELGLARRERLRLLVGHHLQPVLERAQGAVALDQVARRVQRDPAAVGQRRQRDAGPRVAQARLAPAQDELLGLGEELDLADAAAAHLQVVAERPDGGEAAVGVDLALDRVDVADGGVVEVLAPDEGDEAAQERPAGLQVARDRPRLDERRPLPVLAVALVVELGRVGRDRERVAGQVRAQPEVGAEHVAVGGLVLEQVDEGAGRPHRERHGALAAAVAEPLLVVEQDEVDIARVVELAGPVLAHRQDHEAAAGRGSRRVGDQQLAAAHGLAQQVVDDAADREVGEAGERRRHTLERPQAREVGEPDQQGDAAAGAAQAERETRPVAGVEILDLGQQRPEAGLRPVPDEAPQHLRLRQQRLAEERAAAEEAVQDRAPRRLPGGFLGGVPGLAAGQRLPAPPTALDGGRVGGAGRGEDDRLHRLGPSPDGGGRADWVSARGGSSEPPETRT